MGGSRGKERREGREGGVRGVRELERREGGGKRLREGKGREGKGEGREGARRLRCPHLMYSFLFFSVTGIFLPSGFKSTTVTCRHITCMSHDTVTLHNTPAYLIKHGLVDTEVEAQRFGVIL
jgi:hypothetical protein